MAFSIKYIYQAVDRFSEVAEKMKRKANALKEKLDKLGESFQKAGKKMVDVGKSLTTRVTLPIFAIGTASVIAASKIETMQTSFESMLKSQEKAKQMTKDLIDFTARTPFQLDGVGSAAKQLLGFGVAQEEIITKLSYLGDISAGANVPLTDMAAIFGKSKAKGKAMTEELLQLSDRGIPIIQVLSEQLGVSKDKVFELASKSKISFEILEKALISMTTKGGIFQDQMIKQSRTLAGLWSTLKDNVSLAFAEFGMATVAALNLKEAMTSLTTNIQWAVEKFRNLSPEAKKFIVYAVIAAGVLGPLLIGLGILIMSLKYVALGFAMLVSPIALGIYGFIAFGAFITYLYNKFAWFREGVAAFHEGFKYYVFSAIDVGKQFYEKIVSYMDAAGRAIGETINFIAKAINKVKRFFGLASDNEVNIRVKKSVSVDEIKTSSMARVDLNVNDPNNRVDSVVTRRSGNMDLNVGRNMASGW